MRSSPYLAALLVAPSLLISWPSTASAAEPAGAGEPAGEGRLPVAEAERPLTLPRFVLNPELDLDDTHVSGDGAYANLAVGASFGVTDDLTVRASVLPLQLAGPAGSGFHYGQITEAPGPSVGASYRFLRGSLEVAGALDIGIPTLSHTSGIFVTPGVPVRVHVSKALRLDTGAYLPITRFSVDVLRGSASTTTVGLQVPVSVLYDITEPIHVGASTAFQVADFNHAGDTTTIPFTIFAGYAIAGKEGPILDIDPFFTVPFAITPGASSATQTGTYVLGLSVGGFFYL